MAEPPAELAITDAVSNFSIGNHPPQDGKPRSPRSGMRLNRDITSRFKSSRDITANFREAAGQLETGALIKDEFFSLFDAVGALEIMDSKMDSGYLEPGESLEDDYDIFRPIAPDELISILDGLLGLQVAWMTGYPLSQTVLSSVYIENILWPEPKTLDQATFRTRDGLRPTLTPCQSILRVYCILMVKTCDFVYRRISAETFYEEEDFFTQTYNRTLLSAFPSDHVFALAEKVASTVNAEESISQELWAAISSRLDLQLSFARATKFAIEAESASVKQSWQDFSLHLTSVRDSHQWGTSVPNAISSKIQRRLASSVPPKPVVELEFTQVVDFLTRLCKDGLLAESVLDCSGLDSTVMFVSFFQAQYPQPTVYMRCQLQRLILSKFRYLGGLDDKAFSAKDDILNELRRLGNPIEALTDLRDVADKQPSEITVRVMKFVAIVIEPFWNYVRAITMNRSRTRRMLYHTAVEWDGVQMELEEIDVDLQQFTMEEPLQSYHEDLWEFPLSSWAYDMKLRQLILIQQLGFELEIYHRNELSAAYWTLQWICSARHGHLERIMTFVKRRAADLDAPTRAQAEAFNTTLLTLHYHIDYTIAIAALSESLSSLYRALVLLDLLPEPPIAPYSSDTLRHTMRLRPFAHILQPPLPNAAESETSRTAFLNELVLKAREVSHKPPRQSLPPRVEQALALLDHVDDVTKSARKAWDNVSKTRIDISRAETCEAAWKADVKNVQRSAISIGLVSMGTRKWVENGARKGGLEIVVDMGYEASLYHVVWVVPKIKVVHKIVREG